MESVSFQTFGLNINLPNAHRTAEFLIYYLAVSPVWDGLGRIRCNKCPGREFYRQHYNNCGMYCIFTWQPPTNYNFFLSKEKNRELSPHQHFHSELLSDKTTGLLFFPPQSSNKKRRSEHDFIHFPGRFCRQIGKLRASCMENQSERQWCDCSLGILCNRRSLHHD